MGGLQSSELLRDRTGLTAGHVSKATLCWCRNEDRYEIFINYPKDQFGCLDDTTSVLLNISFRTVFPI